MKEKLVIKNFGPIRSAEIELGLFTVLIGEQATGKSTLAKLLAVCRYFSYIVPALFDEHRTFADGLYHWGLNEYVTDNSIVCYQCDHYSFKAEIKKTDIKASGTTPEVVLKNFPHWHLTLVPSSEPFKQLLEELKNIKTSGKAIGIPHSFYTNNVATVMENPLYFPTERSLQSIFALGGSPDFAGFLYSYFAKIDGFFRSFSGETEINPLDITYKNEQGRGYVRKDNTNVFVTLRNGASGYQSTVPIVLAIIHYNKIGKRKSFIIEEPELNLFPTAQKSLIQFLVSESSVYQSSILATTHSPYILASLNNLMCAFEAAKINTSTTEQFIAKKYWLNPDDVSAYKLLSDGTCIDIIDREEGLIRSEEIDTVSTEINQQFDELLNIKFSRQ